MALGFSPLGSTPLGAQPTALAGGDVAATISGSSTVAGVAELVIVGALVASGQAQFESVGELRDAYLDAAASITGSGSFGAVASLIAEGAVASSGETQVTGAGQAVAQSSYTMSGAGSITPQFATTNDMSVSVLGAGMFAPLAQLVVQSSYAIPGAGAVIMRGFVPAEYIPNGARSTQKGIGVRVISTSQDERISRVVVE